MNDTSTIELVQADLVNCDYLYYSYTCRIEFSLETHSYK